MSALKASLGRRATPRLVGAELEVPLVTGGTRRYVNLDYAASTSPLGDVAAAVAAFLPWYSSVHRGAGFKSQVATAAYEGAREEVRAFFHARTDDAVLFVRNTTDATNLMASALPEGTEVVAFEVEHHANMLPWRRPSLAVRYLPTPTSPDAALDALERVLRTSFAPRRLVALTGASNVTGEIWPIAEATQIAHRHGARLLLDGAQLAAHSPLDLSSLGVDYLAVSGHKMYAPYGVGALIGRADWLRHDAPYLRGGGAVDFVTLDSVLWSELPERQEAGSPNVVGAVAMGSACRTLARYGMDRLAAEELELAAYARRIVGAIPGVELYSLWDNDAPRLGILAFNVARFWHSELAAILSAEHGIGVRHGCFCAHPLMLRLLDVSNVEADAIRAEIQAGSKIHVPGAVRASMGLGTTRADVDELAAALGTIVANGPRWAYRRDGASGEYFPDPETRSWPGLPVELAATGSSRSESS